MSGQRGREPGGWSEEALLDWLLEDEGLREPSRSTLVADSEVGARLVALEDWLGRCRGALVPAVDAGQPRRTRLLTRRILSDTTREDLSWRGDLRLVAGYVGARLRASAALRVIAASLVLHLLGLPLLAWVGWLRPEPTSSRILVEAPRHDPFSTYDEPPRVVTSPAEEHIADSEREALRARRYVQNTLRWNRWFLARSLPSVPAQAPDEARADAILRARLRVLAGTAPTAPLASLQPAPDAGSLQKTLWCELLLDRFLVSGSGSGMLDIALTSLCADESVGERLRVSALSRADAYGQLTAAQAGVLERARAGLASDDPLTPLLRREGEARRVAPLDPAWLALLGDEGAGEVSPSLLRALQGR